jgi:hypothetical protein
MVSKHFGNKDVTVWYQNILVTGMLQYGIRAPVSTLSLHGPSFYLS